MGSFAQLGRCASLRHGERQRAGTDEDARILGNSSSATSVALTLRLARRNVATSAAIRRAKSPDGTRTPPE
jgi:hypothetical protein